MQPRTVNHAPNFNIVYPPHNGNKQFGSMHAKFYFVRLQYLWLSQRLTQVQFLHPTYTRFVVYVCSHHLESKLTRALYSTTANLVDYE
jgi:hypothetical protein